MAGAHTWKAGVLCVKSIGSGCLNCGCSMEKGGCWETGCAGQLLFGLTEKCWCLGIRIVFFSSTLGKRERSIKLRGFKTGIVLGPLHHPWGKK